MDAMSYVNIFETKGLEYLLVVSFLLGFLLLMRVLTPRESPTGGEEQVERPGPLMTCNAEFECPFRAHPTDVPEEDDSREEDIVA